MWTLATARTFARRLELELKPVGWHVALTGSVLHKGKSAKDLDLIIYPRSTEMANPEAVEVVLRRIGCVRKFTAAQVHGFWRKAGSRDRKRVEVWYFYAKRKYRRIDVFIAWSQAPRPKREKPWPTDLCATPVPEGTALLAHEDRTSSRPTCRLPRQHDGLCEWPNETGVFKWKAKRRAW